LKNNDGILTLTLRLLIITACAGLILGVVYGVTKGPIEQQQLIKENAARAAVLPAATDFTLLDGLDYDAVAYPEVEEVYEGSSNGQTAGYTLSVVTKGYSPGLSLTIGLDPNGVVTGVDIGSHEETPGLGANAVKPEFLGQYAGADGPLAVVKTPTGADGEIAAITGATITSNAVTGAVNMARAFYAEYFGDGSVDAVAGASVPDGTEGA
jgi:electron transport complex protein RnfG